MVWLKISQTAFGMMLAVGSMVFWIMAAKRWEDAFRRRCERRFGVELVRETRGTWSCRGDRPWLQRFAIEWLQLGFFLGVFVVWAILMIAGLVVLGLR